MAQQNYDRYRVRVVLLQPLTNVGRGGVRKSGIQASGSINIESAQENIGDELNSQPSQGGFLSS